MLVCIWCLLHIYLYCNLYIRPFGPIRIDEASFQQAYLIKETIQICLCVECPRCLLFLPSSFFRNLISPSRSLEVSMCTSCCSESNYAAHPTSIHDSLSSRYCMPIPQIQILITNSGLGL